MGEDDLNSGTLSGSAENAELKKAQAIQAIRGWIEAEIATGKSQYQIMGEMAAAIQEGLA